MTDPANNHPHVDPNANSPPATATTTTTTGTGTGPSAPHNTSPSPHNPPTTTTAKAANPNPNPSPPPPTVNNNNNNSNSNNNHKTLNPFTRHRLQRAASAQREREQRRAAAEEARREALWRGNTELRAALTDRFLHPPDEGRPSRWPAGLPEAARVVLRFVDALDEVVPGLSVGGGTGGDGVWGEGGKEVAVWMRRKKVVGGGAKGAGGREGEEEEEEEEEVKMGRLRGGGGGGSSVSEYSQLDYSPPYDPGNNGDDASSAAAESSSASQQRQRQQRTSHTTTTSSSPPFPRPPNPSPPRFPQPPSQTTTIMPPLSTIFPLHIFLLPIPDRLKDSMLVLLPPRFRQQVHAKATMTEKEAETGTRPTTTPPLWSECFGAMRPKAVAARGKGYEERKGMKFRGPYWVKDAEGRVKAVEDEGERRGLMRGWFGDDDEDDDEDDDDEVSDDGEQAKWRDRGKFRGSGDGNDDDDEQPLLMGKLRGGGMGHVYERGARSTIKVHRDDHHDRRIFRTPPLPRPVDAYDEAPRWLRRRRRRREHCSTIVPIPDWMLDDGELDADACMSLEYAPEKLGISGPAGPPRLEIKGASEPWEVVFPSWTPRELAGLQRGWEECRYGRYDGPYWKSDERGKVRVVDTRQERDRLMEEWFIEGKGKWRGSLSSKQEAKLETHPETRQTGHPLGLRGGGHFDDADDEYSGGEETPVDAMDGWSSDGYQPLGSDGETMRSRRSWSSSAESAGGDRPFAYPNPQARGPSSNADAEAEARGLFDDSGSGSSTYYDLDSDSGSSTYSDEDSDSESSTDDDEDHDGDSGFHCPGNFNRNTRIHIDEDPSSGPCRIYTIDRLDEPTTRNNNDEDDPGHNNNYYHYHLHGTFARGTRARIERDRNGRYSLYIQEPCSATRNNDNTAIARAFRRSLRTHPGRLPGARALWRDYYWAWPQAWRADGGFNWELWGRLLRQLARVRRERARLWRRWQRRERRERRGRRGGGGASGGGRDGHDDVDGESDHRRRRSENGSGGGASGGCYGRRPDDDDVESSHHRGENGSDGSNATLSSDLYWSDSSDEGDDAKGKSPGLSGTTAAASADGGSEKIKSAEASGDEHGKRGNGRGRGSGGGSGSGSGSGSDWEAYWGNLAGKRIPTDEDDGDDAGEPRASGRLDREAERVEEERRRREKDAVARRERAAERRRRDDDDEEKGYDSAASGECREMIRQLCTEGQPPHEIRLQMYLHYLDNDTWRSEEGRASFGYRMLEILDEEIGLAEAGEQQTMSTGSENTVNAWQNRNNDEVGRLRGGNGSDADGGGTSDGDEEPSVGDTRPDEAGEQGGVQGGDGVDQESSDALNFWMFWFVFGDTGR
ncbi:hypothetical protein SLS58_008969 [Diplodia intermedia]|uniref:Uncharacterized protein n=1 Tax=Diplodia intermedia TaxID=856260 RepID=A0ABR3TF59_9PEZI